MAGFDGRCPHCNKSIDGALHGIWTDHDYMTDFVFECPECKQRVQMNVHSVPEFELEKAETPEEYQAKRAALVAAIASQKETP